MSSAQNSSENLLNLAKTDPQAFYDYWRAQLTQEEYARLISGAWKLLRYDEYERSRRPLHLKSALDEVKFERIPPPTGFDANGQHFGTHPCTAIIMTQAEYDALLAAIL